MDPNYNPQDIEVKWQKRWADDKLFATEAEPGRPKYYVLEMLPYPSGDIHMGHVRNYSIGDALARYMAMKGFNILHPIGWDAFGLPAENAAIKHQRHPSEFTFTYIERMRKQLQRLGVSYDWRREIASCVPEYYRWNQWFFLKMYERGLAYRKQSRVNWCPQCETVLANEQVVDGCCWRHEDTPVIERELEQWFLKTTAYAEQLLDDMKELVRWPERVLTMQKNWIGKSTGTFVDFTINDLGKPVSTPTFFKSASMRAREAEALMRSTSWRSFSGDLELPTIFSTSGCSAARKTAVQPKIVSTRVVKMRTGFQRSLMVKSTNVPVDLPIQFFCMVSTRSGQRTNSFMSSSNCSA